MRLLRLCLNVLGIVLFLLFTFLFALRPMESMDLKPAASGPGGTPEQLLAAVAAGFLTSGTISEGDLSDLFKGVAIRAREQGAFPPFLDLDGVKVSLEEGSVEVKAAVTAFHFMRFGPGVRATPVLADGRLGLRVESVRVGRIPFSSAFLMQRFVAPAMSAGSGAQPGSSVGKGPGLSLEGEIIWLDGLLNQLPAAVTVHGITVENGLLKVEPGL